MPPGHDRGCSTRGHRDGPKALHVREWTCPVRGSVHDRDHNAAIDVEQAAGPAVTAEARSMRAA
ncbi:zinc ribbon domain-containing protein [Streptomyces avermitilis]